MIKYRKSNLYNGFSIQKHYISAVINIKRYKRVFYHSKLCFYKRLENKQNSKVLRANMV